MAPGDRSKFAESIAKDYGKSKDSDDAGMPEESESGGDADKEAAGEELAAALKSGDGAEIYRAFEALNELCKGG